MASDIRLRQADEVGAALAATTPRALHVQAVEAMDSLCVAIQLSSGFGLLFPVTSLEGLADATADDLNACKISPTGFGLHFERLDADIWLPSLLEGFTGSARFMAAQLGAKGGAVKSDAKRAAARANGKLGGRPRKHAVA